MNENHPIKDNEDRTKDVANLNRLFNKTNKNSLPLRQVPTLEMVGITEEAFANKPVKNRHIFEEWHHSDRKWPKDKSLAKDVVHLRNSARSIVWKAIHNYFTCIF